LIAFPRLCKSYLTDNKADNASILEAYQKLRFQGKEKNKNGGCRPQSCDGGDDGGDESLRVRTNGGDESLSERTNVKTQNTKLGLS
jgi:hypothetical protein